MLRELLTTSGRLEKFLDKITREKLILWGFISIFSLCVFLSLTLMIPLTKGVEESLGTRTSLEQEIKRIESEQAARAETIPRGSELPEVVGHLQDIYLANDLAVEEILINQLPSASNGSFDESLIKLTVGGERLMILQAIMETLNLSKYPFLIQELEINDQKAVIHLKIFFTKTAQVP